jgi:NTE family protein
MRRALVLGGGGIIGVAWESGIAVGLHQGGYDLKSFAGIVGTSAGAIVGARIASGKVPTLGNTDAARSQQQKPVVDPSTLDLAALKEIFERWKTMTEATPEQVSAIGKLARRLYRDSERPMVQRMRDDTEVHDWPALPLLVATVDTESGERRVFDRESGVSLERAITASAAVPGLFPSIDIQGRLYMDGQVWSSTNAELALAWKPDQVLIAMPTNALSAPAIGPHAERMVELETARLHAAGCTTMLKTPSAEDAAAFCRNMMDPRKALPAYESGIELGKAWAAELAAPRR